MSALLVCVQYYVVIAFPRDFWLFTIISWVSLPPVCLLSYNCCLFHLPTFFDVVMASSFSITNKPGTQQKQKNVRVFLILTWCYIFLCSVMVILKGYFFIKYIRFLWPTHCPGPKHLTCSSLGHIHSIMSSFSKSRHSEKQSIPAL